MTPESKKKFNTAAGSLFLALGLLGYGMALYYAVTPSKAVTHAGRAADVKVSDMACRRVVQRMGGFSEKVTPRGVEVRAPLPSGESADVQAHSLLYAASLIPKLCQRDITYFCLGPGCKEGPGLFMRLAPLEGAAAPVTLNPTARASAPRPGLAARVGG